MDVPPVDVANPNAVAGYDADAGPGCIEGRIRPGSEAACRGVPTGHAQDRQREHGSGPPTQTVRGWVTLVGKIDVVLAPIPMRAACGRYAIDGSDLVTIPNSGGIRRATIQDHRGEITAVQLDELHPEHHVPLAREIVPQGIALLSGQESEMGSRKAPQELTNKLGPGRFAARADRARPELIW